MSILYIKARRKKHNRNLLFGRDAASSMSWTITREVIWLGQSVLYDIGSSGMYKNLKRTIAIHCTADCTHQQKDGS